MSHDKINPLLVHALTGRDIGEIPTFPAVADLTVRYAQLVAKNKKKVPSSFPENIQPLICQKCGKKANII